MRKRKNNGWIVIELTTAMMLLAMILGGLAVSIHAFRTAARINLAREQCMAAGQAQMDSVIITGKPLGDEDIQRLWPGVEVEVTMSQGNDQWQGLQMISVTAKDDKIRFANVTLSRYLNKSQENK